MLSKEEKDDLSRIDSEIYGSSAMAGIGQAGRMQVGSPGDQEILKHLKYFKMFMRRERLLEKKRPSENSERLTHSFDILAEARFFEGDYMHLVDYLVGDTEIKPKEKLDWIKERWKLTVLVDCLRNLQGIMPGSAAAPYVVFADCFTHNGRDIANKDIADALLDKTNVKYEYSKFKKGDKDYSSKKLEVDGKKEKAMKEISQLEQYYFDLLK